LPLTLPVIQIIADTLPEGWERAVLATWEQGARIATQYDQEGDPHSRDALLVLTIRDPFAEPRIHRAFPGGITELEAYRQEVVDGIHDHWIDPAAGKWEYTYHERLAAYSVPGLERPVNQLDYVVDALSEAPHTRRAQAITWKPWEDAGIHDPACLQRLWFRIFGDELILNCHIRSNDAFKAAFMNMYAFTDLQRVIAERVSARLGRAIRAGQYTHIADSFHVYGSYFAEFEQFLETLQKRSFEQRTWRTEDIRELIEDAQEEIRRSLERERETGRKGL
jgi:thymidylate synthase